MRLILMRHGIAIDRLDPECPRDFDRALTGRGRRRTRLGARGLAVLGVRPDVVLSSPYVRALQTAEIVAEEVGFEPRRIRLSDALQPGGSPRAVIEEAARAGGETVLCTGHLPNLDGVLAAALGNGGRLLTTMKKASAACVELSRGLGPELRWYYPPRALRLIGTAADLQRAAQGEEDADSSDAG